MNIETWLFQNAERVNAVSESPRLDVELLLAERLGKTRAYLLAFSDEILVSDVLIELNKDVERLASGYPLAYLLGKKDFWDMELIVTEATLIPRPDTETLIEVSETLFVHDTDAKIIDLGTGSGAIAIALSRIFPKAQITATDISAEALDVARKNAIQWQKAPIRFTQTSWLEGFRAGDFDLIVSNPPYIVEGDSHLPQLKYEPITALTAANNGLADIEIIISQSEAVLKPSGWLLIEHGYDQGKAVRDLLECNFWQNVKTHRDLGNNDRVTVAQRL